MHIKVAALVLWTGMLAALPVQAQMLSVCANVSVTATPLTFNYFPASDSQNSASIKLSCGFGLFVLPDVTVSLAAGNSGTFTARRMDDSTGNNHLKYNIYTMSGDSTVWGDGTSGTQTQSISGSLLGLGNYSFTAYGLVPSGQYVTATSYSDSIMVLVTF